MSRVLITGCTYPVRHALKRLGGQWDPREQGWWVPEQHSSEATQLVSRSVLPAPRQSCSNNAQQPTPKQQHFLNLAQRALTRTEHQ